MMKIPSATMNTSQDELAMLERLLREGAVTEASAQRYYAASLACGQLARARRLFDLLRQKHPDNLPIAGLYIATCLQQGDDPAAMNAIEALAGRTEPPDGLLDAGLSVRRRLGPMRPASSADCLSLCMIARNEGRMLGPCLFGIKSLVDEIILVDTGSQDRTADIGLLFGAQVHGFTWCDDFSAARNFALSKASGKWILVLDADEAIAPSDFKTIRELIRSRESTSVAFTLETRNYCHTANAIGWQANEGRYPSHEAGLGWFPSRKVRLFQRRSDIRFHFPVHERVEPSLKNRRGIDVCKVPVHHYGHLNETRNQEKARKYYMLGYAKLDAMGKDPGAIRELAVQAGQLARWEEAILLWERLLSIRPTYAEAVINISGAYWQMKDYERALIFARQAVTLDPDIKEAQYNVAVSLLLLGRADQAVKALQHLTLRRCDYLAGHFMLAVATACIGNRTKSLDILQSLQKTPAGSALDLAIRDLIDRMEQANLKDYVRSLTEITTFLPDAQTER